MTQSLERVVILVNAYHSQHLNLDGTITKYHLIVTKRKYFKTYAIADSLYEHTYINLGFVILDTT